MTKTHACTLQERWRVYSGESLDLSDILQHFIPFLKGSETFKKWTGTYEPVDLHISDITDSFSPHASSSRFVFYRRDAISLATLIDNITTSTKVILVADSDYSKSSTLKFIEAIYTRMIHLTESFRRFDKDWGKEVFDWKRFSLDMQLFCPIYLDLKEVTRTEPDRRESFWGFIFKETLGKRAAELWKELTRSELYILLLDNFDSLFRKNRPIAVMLMNRLKRLRCPWILTTRRHHSLSEILQKHSFRPTEILPLDRTQRLEIIRKVLRRFNKQQKKTEKIHLRHANDIERLVPTLILPEDSQNPAFIIPFTELMLDFLRKTKPYTSTAAFKEFEVCAFYDHAQKRKIPNIETIVSAKSFNVFRMASQNAKILIDRIEKRQEIDVSLLFPQTVDWKYSDSFLYRRLLISSAAYVLDVSRLRKFLRTVFDSSCQQILRFAPYANEDENKRDNVQACFEYVVIILKYLKKSFQSMFKELQALIFQRMYAVFYCRNHSSLVKWYSLLIMRLSYDPYIDQIAQLSDDVGTKILTDLEALDPAGNRELTGEESQLSFAALLFLMKSFLDRPELVETISSKLHMFIQQFPLSGFTLYAYLENGKEKFAESIEPILCANDEEPPNVERGVFQWVSPNVVLRAIQALGTFGNERDVDLLIDHGFLNINAPSTYSDSVTRRIGLIERMTHYAIEEILYHEKEIPLDEYRIRPLAVSLCALFEDRLQYLFDTLNKSLSIYSMVYSDIQRRIQSKFGQDHQRKLALFVKAGAILNSINKQYFRDKSFAANRGKLKLSLRRLEEELRALHNSTLYEIVDPNMWFENRTVAKMRNIVRSEFEAKPGDLIDLSEISFERWDEKKKLGEADQPVFLEYVKEKSRTSVPHVIRSNKDILTVVPEIYHPKKTDVLYVLDIGSGIGNTTEAIIRYYFPRIKKRIIAVELLREFVEQYCQRIRIVTALKFYLTGFNEKLNYEIDCVNQDIHRFLEQLSANNGVVRFTDKDSLRHEVFKKKWIWGGVKNSWELVSHLDEVDLRETWRATLRKLVGTKKKEEFKSSFYNCCATFNRLFHTFSNRRNFEESELKEKLEIRHGFDLIVANYVLHHLTKEYRKDVYRWLLRVSKPKALFAISDPNLGISHYNVRYFNFIDEGVFASFTSPSECTKEVEETVENGYHWKRVAPEAVDYNVKKTACKDIEVGFHIVFQKTP